MGVTFPDIYAYLHSLDISQKGKLFERLARSYLLCLDKYNFKEVYGWYDWEYRESIRDIGIDLVGEQHNGDLIAIQCKCYQREGALSKSDADSFLALASREFENKKFAGSIIISTANGVSDNLYKTIEKQTPPCHTILYFDLESADLDWSKEAASLRPAHALRDYQRQAIEKTIAGFENNDKGQLLMACGTGKTFTSLRLVEAMGVRWVLVLAPSLNLISQMSTEYSKLKDAGRRQHHLVVCSDKTIHGKEYDTIADTPIDVPATTDPHEISRFLLKAYPEKEICLVFSTYQSLAKIHDAFEENQTLRPFDLVICDEAHNIAGKENTMFDLVIRDFQAHYEKVLFMTATPKLYSLEEQVKASSKNVSVTSMDDETKYGEVFFNYTFKKAIEEDNLCDYELVIFEVKSKNLPPTDKGYFEVYNHLEDEEVTRSLEELFVKYKLEKTISFARKIENSKKFKNVLRGHEGFINIEHVDGGFPTSERYQLISWLAGKDYAIESKREESTGKTYRILSNARCLSEGVDVPSVNGIIFLNPKGSMIDIIQSIGRAIRKSRGKEKGYILIPIILPEAFNEKQALGRSDYKAVLDVLLALRAYDDEQDLRELLKHKVRFERLSEEPSEQHKEKPEQLYFRFEELLKDKVVELESFVRKTYLTAWFKKIPDLLTHLRTSFEEHKPAIQKELDEIRLSFQNTIREDIEESDIREVFIQHILTNSILDEVFQTYNFSTNNPLSKQFSEIETRFFGAEALRPLHGEIKTLLANMKSIVMQKDTFEDKYTFLINLYEGFYEAYDRKMVDKLGIVYTPKEVVDFIVRSSDELLQKHFDANLATREVDILDPCTGTGTFVFRLLEHLFERYGREDFLYKYRKEIYCNELVLLAYYIGTLCIESKFMEKIKHHEKFEGIVYQDTLDLLEFAGGGIGEPTLFGAASDDNYLRRKKQNQKKMTVIMGNPPYSANQANVNENNQNRRYPVIENRIRNTYTLLSKSQANKSDDTYVSFIRWSSDRIHEKGILAFVTNSGFIENKAFDGFRAAVEEEFDYVYLVDLGGNVRKYLSDPNIFIGEKHTIFGKSAATGVCIFFFIKTGEKKPKAEIKYIHPFEIEELRTQKLKFLSENSISDLTFEKITPRKGYWLDTQETGFNELIPVVSKDKAEKTIFDLSSSGVTTNRDHWIYDLDERILQDKVKYFIETYNNLIKKYHGSEKAFENINIKWDQSLQARFKAKQSIQFNKKKLVRSIYRPFSIKYSFLEDNMIRSKSNATKLFGKNLDKENVCIGFIPPPGRGRFNALTTNIIPELCHMDTSSPSSLLPLYRYEGNERQDNITDGSLEKFRAHYKDDTITKPDIFHYVYAVFHNPDYVEKYRVDLQRGLPRVPFYKDFHELAGLGHELMRLHIDFEKAEKHKAVKLIESEGDIRPFLKAEKNKKREYTGTIFLDSITRFEGIPPRAFAYKLGHSSPMEWVLKQHAPKSPTAKDKQNYAKIFELFNTPENEFRRYKEVSRPYLIDLIPRLVTVSLKTLEMREKVRGRGFDNTKICT